MGRLAELFHGWTLILGIACLVLAAVVADELWLIYRNDVPPVSAAAPGGSGVEGTAIDIPPAREFVLPPLTTYQEIVARPLFMESRRPPSPEEEESEPQQATPAQPLPKTLRLTSVVITDSARFALVEDTSAKKLRRVKQGQELEGWKVAEIHPGKIVFEHGASRETMGLRVYNKYVPPVPKPSRAARAARPQPGVPGAAPVTAQGRAPGQRAQRRKPAQRRQIRRPGEQTAAEGR